jgi:hypothetical protein
MRRYINIQLGDWKFENGRLYHWTEHRDAKTGGLKARWFMWDRVTLNSSMSALSGTFSRFLQKIPSSLLVFVSTARKLRPPTQEQER